MVAAETEDIAQYHLGLPEVSLIAILDAYKEGFLRNDRSLTQTAGRAARNVNGLVIFYADVTTDSMHRTIEETNRRRSFQMAYNEEHNITPTTMAKSREEILARSSVLDIRGKREYYIEPEKASAAKELDFITAAQFRDEMLALKERLK
ncbi:MAG: hypothetical protein K9J37_14755 [Saprospiraceae bacterium]|nr:hypothetical protein [Saprospiraceae bacterium]MCF8251168.1 hypothetical protein [Saprospiraceae bacterium]MCF8281891.1 hypothetical protein [Bacteroidales bacterium]MCF8312980.1 hypothetical protein [Saprospiraceae bacterium]MCF8441427.1 hypothetical protein [Saprospiraceae bacterium]